ncbi:hypothetical protein [Nocardioides sp. AN3]
MTVALTVLAVVLAWCAAALVAGVVIGRAIAGERRGGTIDGMPRMSRRAHLGHVRVNTASFR